MSIDYYFDYMASTPIDPLVSQVMQEYADDVLLHANPSADHPAGKKANELMLTTQSTMKKVINAHNDDKLIFTSGATEASNLALRGAASQYKRNGKHLITTQTEHQATLSTLKSLEEEGFNITLLPVKKDGLLDLVLLESTIREDTIIFSIAGVNNEIGVVQDLRAISAICKKHGVLLHVDAAQCIGKVRIDLKETPIDLMSFSAHKCYGPKGIGALYCKKQIKLQPIMFGGQQQSSTRPGTIPLMLIVAMGKAWELANKRFDNEYKKIIELQTFIKDNLHKDIILHGSTDKRVAHNIMVSLPSNSNKNDLLMLKNKFNLSSAAACSHSQRSHVLQSLGIEDKLQKTALRISLGRWSKKETCEELVARINKICEKAKAI